MDRISIVVKDVAGAEREFKKTFGWEVNGQYTDPGEKIRVGYFMVGPTAVELMEDLNGTGEVAKFIAKHGKASWSSPSTWTTVQRNSRPWKATGPT